jgi:hypothetical protein
MRGSSQQTREQTTTERVQRLRGSTECPACNSDLLLDSTAFLVLPAVVRSFHTRSRCSASTIVARATDVSPAFRVRRRTCVNTRSAARRRLQYGYRRCGHGETIEACRPTGRVWRSLGLSSLQMSVDGKVEDSEGRWLVLAGCDVCIPDGVPAGSPSDKLATASGALRGVICFIGGFLVGQFPRATYGPFLEQIARRTQMAVIAAPFFSAAVAPSKASTSASAKVGADAFSSHPVPDTTLFFDHLQLAEKLRERFRDASASLSRLLASPERLPAVGMGHSLGAKLLALMHAEETTAPNRKQRAGLAPKANIFLAYNNYSSSKSIPFFEDATKALDAVAGSDGWRMVESFLRDATILGSSARLPTARGVQRYFRDLAEPQQEEVRSQDPGLLGIWPEWASLATGAARALRDREFTPSPQETRRLIESYYSCASNLIVKFADDPIDQSDDLAAALWYRFADREKAFEFRQVPGGHLVPVSAAYRRMFPFDTKSSRAYADSRPNVRYPVGGSMRTGQRSRRDAASDGPDPVDLLVDVIGDYLSSLRQQTS